MTSESNLPSVAPVTKKNNETGDLYRRSLETDHGVGTAFYMNRVDESDAL